jgi:murein DD-endopeptidase MepM/ murein hydrolase activator NlpD
MVLRPPWKPGDKPTTTTTPAPLITTTTPQPVLTTTTPAPVTPTTPAPKPPTTPEFPQGNVKTKRANNPNKAYDVPWSRATELWPLFAAAGKKWGVDPYLLLAMGLIESDWTHERDGHVIERWDNFPQDGPSVGLMQPKPQLWQHLSPGDDAYTLKGNINLGAALMADAIKEHGTWQKALTRRYFPTNDPNGTTQSAYVKAVTDIMAESLSVSKPKPKPKPVNIIGTIMGNRPTDTSYGYKSPAVQIGIDQGWYTYFEGRGGTRREHPGIDASGVIGQTLYSPIPGKIVCAGTGRGPGSWDTGCAAFGDTMGQGAGRIEILHDDGQRSLILGHCSEALAAVGSAVRIGQPVAKLGGMNGAHVHIEGRKWNGSDYDILNPVALFADVVDGESPVVVIPQLPPYKWLGTPNFMSRQGIAPVAIVYHVTDDMSLGNVTSWFQNPNSDASSHWVIDRDGMAYQFVGSAQAAFTNGDVKNPRQDIPWLKAITPDLLTKRTNLNYYTITFEHIGEPDVPFTPEQIATSVALSQYYLAVYGIARDRGHMIRHSDINSVDRRYCPGELFPLADIIVACGGDPTRLAA